MTEFLALVSKPEIRWKNSHARLEARDWKKEILDLVSKHEIERKKISISSQSMRLKEKNSRSRLESWNRALVGHCPNPLPSLLPQPLLISQPPYASISVTFLGAEFLEQFAAIFLLLKVNNRRWMPVKSPWWCHTVITQQPDKQLKAKGWSGSSGSIVINHYQSTYKFQKEQLCLLAEMLKIWKRPVVAHYYYKSSCQS